MRMMIHFAIVGLLALLSIPSSVLAQSCTAKPVAVQILGSGGPGVNRDRASSSYLFWIDAQARILVDMAAVPSFALASPSTALRPIVDRYKPSPSRPHL